MSSMDEPINRSALHNENNTKRMTFAQYQYKLSTYHHRIMFLILLQIIAAFFILLGNESFSSTFDNYSININQISGNIILIFTFIWAFINGLHINSKKAQQLSYAFISTRRVHHLSNLLYMLTISAFAGVSASLLGFVPKMIIYFLNDNTMFIFADTITITELIGSIVVATLYVFLLLTIGYFLGGLTKIHPILIFFLPILLVGLALMDEQIVIGTGEFFIKETHIALFMLKTVAISLVLMYAAVLLDHRLEVA